MGHRLHTPTQIRILSFCKSATPVSVNNFNLLWFAYIVCFRIIPCGLHFSARAFTQLHLKCVKYTSCTQRCGKLEKKWLLLLPKIWLVRKRGLYIVHVYRRSANEAAFCWWQKRMKFFRPQNEHNTLYVQGYGHTWPGSQSCRPQSLGCSNICCVASYHVADKLLLKCK